MTRISFLIVGGGIGGLAAALALARRGVAVHLIEKAAEFGELGAGIQLAPNASFVLDRLGILESIAPLAVFPKRISWLDAISGEPLTSLDLGARFRARYGYDYIVMHRSDLLAALLRACRAHPLIALETDKDVVAVEDRVASAVAVCADGTSYACDALIGADGLWSTVRRFVIDDGDPICCEYVAYRGAIPIAEVSASAELDEVVLWTGPEMHLVQYPVRRGELYNQVAVFKSARYRPDSDDWGTPDELDARFGAGAQRVQAALTKIKRDRRWPMFDRLPAANWTRHRITLLGDAAHPMLQYLAQGACQALEDALALAGAVAADRDDFATALRAYQTTRAERAGRVQTTARAWGEFWHVHPGDQLSRRNAALAARAPDEFSETDWFYAR
ncbi:MAG: FAD-dependent monooxygenase, partial [Vulcanimicrobiaceae bacterium]